MTYMIRTSLQKIHQGAWKHKSLTVPTPFHVSPSPHTTSPAMSWLSKAVLFTVASTVAVHGALVTKDWTLAAGTISPDGFKRSATLVNGQFPGPPLTVNKGDAVTVNLYNKLADPTMRRSTSIVRRMFPSVSM
jgi:hypothetical protein